MIHEFTSERLIFGKLIVTWGTRTVSEAHPLIDPARIVCDTIDSKTGEDLEHWEAGGYQVRCALKPTSRSTRAICVGWKGARVPHTLKMRRVARERRRAVHSTVGTRSLTDAEAVHPMAS